MPIPTFFFPVHLTLVQEIFAANLLKLLPKKSAEQQMINVALVGLGFGAEFIPIYQKLDGIVFIKLDRFSKKEGPHY